MNQEYKRRRGGQPGNQNAKNNPGNRHARGTKGNRGGKGAPLFNQFAAKTLTLEAALRRDFRREPEAMDWIRRNSNALREVELAKDNDRLSSRYNYSADELARTGQEFRHGIFCASEDDRFRP